MAWFPQVSIMSCISISASYRANKQQTSHPNKKGHRRPLKVLKWRDTWWIHLFWNSWTRTWNIWNIWNIWLRGNTPNVCGHSVVVFAFVDNIQLSWLFCWAVDSYHPCWLPPPTLWGGSFLVKHQCVIGFYHCFVDWTPKVETAVFCWSPSEFLIRVLALKKHSHFSGWCCVPPYCRDLLSCGPFPGIDDAMWLTNEWTSSIAVAIAVPLLLGASAAVGVFWLAAKHNHEPLHEHVNLVILRMSLANLI